MTNLNGYTPIIEAVDNLLQFRERSTEFEFHCRKYGMFVAMNWVLDGDARTITLQFLDDIEEIDRLERQGEILPCLIDTPSGNYNALIDGEGVFNEN